MFEFLKHLFKLQFLLILVAIIGGVYYPQILEQLRRSLFNESAQEQLDTHLPGESSTEQLFTKEQLSTYNGEEGTPLYLALLGSVYDVSKGAKHYGAGCAYNFFVGRDASVSFVTGEFDDYNEETADDVITLKLNDLLSLDNWSNFYNKDYTYVGKLIGRFYDVSGAPTPYHYKYLALVEQAKEMKTKADQLRTTYPDCNIQWTEEKGTRVWCTTSSGGKERNWIGYPRKLFEVGKENFRCACIRAEELQTTAVMIKPYDNCASQSHECFYTIS